MATSTTEDVSSDSDAYHSADEDIDETKKVRKNCDTTSDSVKRDTTRRHLDCEKWPTKLPVQEPVVVPENTNICQTILNTMTSNENPPEPVIGGTGPVDSVKQL